MKALGLQKGEGWPKEIKQDDHSHPVAYYTIKDKLRNMLRKNERAKFVLTGHILGGALAIIFPLVFALHEEEWMLKRLEGVYTFGQPRVGDEKLVEYMKEKLSSNGVNFMKTLGIQRSEGWPKEIKQEDHNHPVAYYTMRDKLKDMLRRNERAKFVLTRHNLGGALAIVFPLVLVLHEEEGMLKRLEGVYTFGQPDEPDELPED
ncbi:hypothetical protein GIB67_017598 [Kingdonia uniflora]|uniref:Fungal lipase-type domain-containing protein n=1 Tax=Kingdonia uniflora TaxID=39325 RepID=A0A7J7LN85_9MAGN|nr:hypothetical protein GIB67_017598 [Kingdonia uniflora]